LRIFIPDLKQLKSWFRKSLYSGIFLGILPFSLFAHPGQRKPIHLQLDSLFERGYAMGFDSAAVDHALMNENPKGDRLFALLAIKSSLALSSQDLETALAVSREALRHLPPGRENWFAAYCRNQLGLVWAYQDKRDASLQEFWTTDSLAHLAGNPRLEVIAKLELAELYRAAGKFETALNLLDKARTVLAQAPDETLDMQLRTVSVGIYNEQYYADREPQLLNQAQAMIDTLMAMEVFHRFPTEVARIQAEQGSIYRQQKQYSQALEAFKKAQQLYAENDRPANVIDQQINIFHLLLETNRSDEALALAEEILRSSTEIGFTHRNIEVYLALFLHYEKHREFEKALKFFGLYVNQKVVNDSLLAVKDLRRLETQMRTLEKEAALKLSEQEKDYLRQQGEAKTFQLNFIQVVAAVIAVLLIAVAVLAIRFSRAAQRIKAQAQELEQKNQVITRALADKEFLFQELHHRVKNNLQLIASFMDLQRRSRPGYNVEDFIRDTENKIQAMTLVHNQLYLGQDIGSANLLPYFREIGTHLLQAHGDARADLELAVEGDSLSLPIEIVVPLGLMVNEIITNSIKYAFENWEGQDPQIVVNVEQHDQKAIILIRDNGKGFPPAYNPIQVSSLGSKVILLLSRQIHAMAEHFNDQGAGWRITLNLAGRK
jgi:two-component system, sensor histidine kinase PdtaS